MKFSSWLRTPMGIGTIVGAIYCSITIAGSLLELGSVETCIAWVLVYSTAIAIFCFVFVVFLPGQTATNIARVSWGYFQGVIGVVIIWGLATVPLEHFGLINRP